ncbi:MAG TPA: hypothetical protein VFA41_08060 [Ktedonobacteraceae bacterium]|jgi:hypothetical protein|nr:hypothetical protein [Ktedonobacteraceae bacterium]
MMNLNNLKQPGSAIPICHPERSEGSSASTDESLGPQILRCAQDDIQGITGFVRKTSSSLPYMSDEDII